LPARFRRNRVLIVGCGDVGLRVARLLTPRVRVLALTSQATRIAPLRAAGITPLLGNLDDVRSLRRLAALGQRVLHLAPPAPSGSRDGRSAHVLQALRLRLGPLSLVYGSTTGVYGDCQGEWVSEVRALQPQTERAHRRVDAETHVRHFGRATGAQTRVLRIPGIYAPDREGGTPLARLQKGTPVLVRDDDVYTNHIHAEDLARACLLALWRGRAQGVYNVNDDAVMKMGDYMDAAAALYGLAQPPRLPRESLVLALTPMQMSFLAESRRMDNRRMKRELRLVLGYPSVLDGLAEGLSAGLTSSYGAGPI
jgi:nucleoside-diphosphate-sugar epimerase